MTFTPDLSGTSIGAGGRPKPIKMKPIVSEEMAAMRNWCMGQTGVAQGETTVLLHVSHSNLKKTFFQEIRLDMHMTVVNVKHKLEFHTGTSAVSNTLYLLDEEGNMIAECEDDKKLGYYSPYDQCRLHIVDLDPNSASAGGWLEDVSLVTKYEISEEAYNARTETFRKFKATKISEDPNWTIRGEMERRRQEKEGGKPVEKCEPRPVKPPIEDEEHLGEMAAKINEGDRCESAGGRRGEVMFVGKVPELPLGYWVGVKYDEPVGKNDGSVKGTRYFECLDGYGGFLRPSERPLALPQSVLTYQFGEPGLFPGCVLPLQTQHSNSEKSRNPENSF
eukprot:CAMPEP_0180154878 /NCGR_PEP_ID=MMETSP0986-20121125/24453_1 /TAXON_ID=697907 /ORGANISM="non described non described, Strain CCMP2293" /LENGTH=333 /DNA_ID=CAMNT_0022103381 /DNA_START=12 /DNA_END=1013 /DNA_ORIENTATION=-